MKRQFTLTCGSVLLFAIVCSAQQRANVEVSADQVIQHAIDSLGGRAYLAVRSLVGHGLFTAFQAGAAGAPLAFTDYLVFPDRERAEFPGFVMANSGNTGWTQDSATGAPRLQDPVQIQDFQISMRTSIHNVLLGWWRQEGSRASYAKRAARGSAEGHDVVRLVYPDGFVVEFEFDGKTGLPVSAVYRRLNAPGHEVVEEDRFSDYATVRGVTVPLTVDHFRAGDRVSRAKFSTVEVNAAVLDSLFAAPANTVP